MVMTPQRPPTGPGEPQPLNGRSQPRQGRPLPPTQRGAAATGRPLPPSQRAAAVPPGAPAAGAPASRPLPPSQRAAAARPVPPSQRAAAAAAAVTAAKEPRPKQARVVLRQLTEPASANWVFLLGITIFLILFGLVMVLSSASVTDYARTHDFFGTAARQASLAIIGVPAMLLVAQFPAVFWRKWVWIIMWAAFGLQLMVFTTAGLTHGINRNWVSIFGFTLQPSEFIKLALVICLGVILSARQDSLYDARELARSTLPVAGGALALVLFGGDLGTAMVMAALMLGCAYFGGVPMRYLLLVMAIGAAGAWAFAMLDGSRVARITEFYNGVCDYEGGCWQSTHATFALAAGGFFGVGLGNSSAKWSWIPEVENDFIFAVIGEELGLLGALVVILLYVLFAVACFRIIASTDDPFTRIVAGGVMTWITVQAFMNIGVVLGLLPVLGVPLPFISAGGSSLLASMLAVGVVLSFAKSDRKRAR